jgi:hypothetical protein
MAATQPNDQSFAEIINHDVLERHRKALVILGGNHVTKNGDNTTSMVEMKHPGSTFVVSMLFADWNTRYGDTGPMKEKLLRWHAPAFLPIDGTWLSSVVRLRQSADAVLYLGPSSTFLNPDWKAVLDESYKEELARRYKVVYGCTFDPSLLGKGPGRRPCK